MFRATPATPTQLPDIPMNSSVRRVDFTSDSIEAISVELGQPIALAPFRVHGEPVYRVVIPLTGGAIVPASAREIEAEEPGAFTTLTLWPSLRRVDAVNPWATVVATGIIAVDLVTGVEAIFRHAGGNLTVARNGRIMVRTGLLAAGADSSNAERTAR